MHTFTIKLKQHTPLIHFQHDQQGATLRASEVKPRLDKFILTQLGGGNYEKGCAEAKGKGWFVGKGEHPVLNYKMSIEASGRKEYLIGSLISSDNPKDKPEQVTILTSTPYFAQEQENKKVIKKLDQQSFFLKTEWDKIPKKGLKWNTVLIRIFSINADVLDKVRNNVLNFFLCVNFGNRSDKGFGSFTVISIDGEEYNEGFYNEGVYLSAFKCGYSFCYRNVSHPSNETAIFSTIKEDYMRLKSGKNHRGYKKSLLFCYAVDKLKDKPRWEKRYFKQKMRGELYTNGYNLRAKVKDKRDDGKPVFNPPIADSSGRQNWLDKPRAYNYNYLRACLGLAEQYEFLINGRGPYEKAVVKVEGGDIERFQSPLVFKVIDNEIYLLGNEPTAILGKHFNFTYKLKSSNASDAPLKIEEEPLSTPKDFSLADFMRYAMYEAKEKLDYKQLF